MDVLKELELELQIAKKIKLEKSEIENLERLIERYKKIDKKENKMNIITKIIAWITSIILMAIYSASIYPQQVEYWELMIEFDSEYRFSQSLLFTKIECEKRAKIYSADGVKAYCVRRGKLQVKF